MSVETTTTTLCSECWSEHAKSDLVNIDGKMVCRACKDRQLQRLHEGVPSSNVLEYAGFWIRFVAKFIDTFVFVGSLYAIIFLILGLSGYSFKSIFTPEGLQSLKSFGLIIDLLELVFCFVLPIFFLGKFAATPGKMLLGLRVVRSDGNRVTYLRAFCRYLSEFLSSIILLIGYIMAGFTGEKTALHDIICDTRVIKK